jgi:hypothetical protein
MTMGNVRVWLIVVTITGTDIGTAGVNVGDMMISTTESRDVLGEPCPKQLQIGTHCVLHIIPVFHVKI